MATRRRALLLLLVSMTATASAQPDALEVEWIEGGVCPPPAGLVADVAVLLGGELPRSSLPRFVVATRAGDRGGVDVELRVYTDAGEGRRTLSTADCHEASQAAAMLIALSIAPEEDAPVEATPPPPPPAEPESNSTPATVIEREPSAAAGWGLAATGGIDVGQLPAPALLAGIGVFWRSQLLQMELFATWTGPSRIAIVEQPGASIQMVAVAALARGCLLGAVGDFRLGPCLAVRSGYVIGRARGLSDGRNSGAPWLSSGLDVRLQWQVSDVVALQLTWGVEVGIVRPIFGIQGSATQYTLPNINSAGGIGIALFL